MYSSHLKPQWLQCLRRAHHESLEIDPHLVYNTGLIFYDIRAVDFFERLRWLGNVSRYSGKRVCANLRSHDHAVCHVLYRASAMGSHEGLIEIFRENEYGQQAAASEALTNCCTIRYVETREAQRAVCVQGAARPLLQSLY